MSLEEETFDGTIRSSVFQYVSDAIEPGDSAVCIGGRINTPGDFFVISYNQWNILERFMRTLEKYENVPQNEEFVKKLKTGEVLAANYVEGGGWHRAVFLKFMDPLEDGEVRCQVFLVDYGDIVVVNASLIRELKGEHKELKAQAIRCCAQLGWFYNPLYIKDVNGPQGLRGLNFNEGEGWTREEGTIFQKMIFNHPLVINFRKQTCFSTGDTVWEVFVHRLPLNMVVVNPKIEFYHIERTVMTHSRGIYLLTKNEEEFKEGSVTIQWRSLGLGQYGI